MNISTSELSTTRQDVRHIEGGVQAGGPAAIKIETVKRNCPSCGSSARGTQSVSSHPPAENADFSKVSDSWQQFFKEKVFFTYVECGACGLMYCPTYFSPASIQAMYSHMTDNTASVPLPVLKRTAQFYKNLLKKSGKLGGVMAEFGPDIGLFAEACAKENLYQNYLFLEPNLNVHRQLRESVSPAPAVIYAGLQDYSKFRSGELNSVAMIHVLDHILDPVPVLRELRTKIVAGGTVFAVVHNRSSVLARVLGAAWPPFCLQHPQLFNPQTLSGLLTQAGFKVKTVRKTLNYFPVDYLFNHLFYALGFKKIRAPRWLSFAIPLYLGNIAIVAEA